MSFCPECGGQLKPDDKFCPKCGHSFESPSDPAAQQSSTAASAPPAAAATTSTSAPPRKRLSGCAIAGIVGGGLLAIIGIFSIIAIWLAMALTAKPVETFEAHLAALTAGKLEVAYQGTSPEFRANTSLETYRQFVASYPALQDVADTSFSERTVENDLATLSGSLIGTQGIQTPFRAQLRLQSDVWWVQAIDLSGVPPLESSSPAPPVAATPEASPSAPPVPAAAATSPSPTSQASSVGTIVVGAGRDTDGELVNPALPIPSGAPTISADIELIDHPLGEVVQVWVEQGENQTKPIDATIEGAGSGSMPFDLHVGDESFPPGRYTLVVMLGGQKRFTQSFEIR